VGTGPRLGGWGAGPPPATGRGDDEHLGGRRPGGDVVGRLLLSAWRSRGLIAAVVLVGALVGDGWAARQPTRYQGVARVVLGPAPPVEVLAVTPVDPRQSLGRQAQRMRSAPVLEPAVKGTGNRISAETLGQRLEVDAAKDADVLTIRVLDSTATGAAQLAIGGPNRPWPVAWPTIARAIPGPGAPTPQPPEPAQGKVGPDRGQAGRRAGGPGSPGTACGRPSPAVGAPTPAQAAENRSRTRPPMPLVARAAVPNQPSSPGPGRAMVTGTLLGLLGAAVVVWWGTRRQGPRSRSSASEPGPEMPSPA
jgi:hypothetical protein